jgi:IMP dehydrogenase
MSIRFEETFSFDDVLLKPQWSRVKSRSEVDVSVELPKKFKFSHPLIPANMKTVTGEEMCDAMVSSGGLAILHRFIPFEEQLEVFSSLCKKHGVIDGTSYLAANHVGLSIGVKEQDYKNIRQMFCAGVKIVCVDIAHLDSKLGLEMVEYIHKHFPSMLLIAGNVASGDAAKRAWEAGADVVKVGIGSGAICSTRLEAASGVPQLSAIIEVAEAKLAFKSKRKVAFISDGGCKITADVAKALCFADMVMAGNLFAGTNEAPGKTILEHGVFYKEYSGSSTLKEDRVEGVKAMVPSKGPVSLVLKKLIEGIQSACSYQNSFNLTELKECPVFVKISSSSIKESGIHDVIVKDSQ